MCLRLGVGSLLLGLALSSAGAAQAVTAEIELKSGRPLRGELVSMDVERVYLIVDGKALDFGRDEIRSLRMDRESRGASSAQREDERVLEQVLGSGDDLRPLAVEGQDRDRDQDQDQAGQDQDEAGPVTPLAGDSSSTKSQRLSHDRRVADLLDRYIWVVPSRSGSRFGVGAALLVFLAVLLGFSERIANAPRNGFGRSMGFAILLTTIAGVGASALPLAPMPLAGLAMIGVLAHVSGSVAFFGCKLLEAFVAFLSFVMVFLLSVAALEMLGVLMSAREMM